MQPARSGRRSVLTGALFMVAEDNLHEQMKTVDRVLNAWGITKRQKTPVTERDWRMYESQIVALEGELVDQEDGLPKWEGAGKRWRSQVNPQSLICDWESPPVLCQTEGFGRIRQAGLIVACRSLNFRLMDQ
jgi:hypothetical protein